MDLNEIYKDLADVLRANWNGWNSYDHLPNDPQEASSFMLGVPTEVSYHRTFAGGSGSVRFPVTVVLPFTGDPKDAQERLRAIMGRGVPGSLVDFLESLQSTSWKALAVDRAANWRLVDAGAGRELAADLEITISC
jgi:hypothetical protein